MSKKAKRAKFYSHLKFLRSMGAHRKGWTAQWLCGFIVTGVAKKARKRFLERISKPLQLCGEP